MIDAKAGHLVQVAVTLPDINENQLELLCHEGIEGFIGLQPVGKPPTVMAPVGAKNDEGRHVARTGFSQGCIDCRDGIGLRVIDLAISLLSTSGCG